MRILSLLIKLAVFLLLLGFAVKNTDNITVRYFFGLEWQSPLAFVLFVLFALGVVAGIFTSLGVVMRQRRELQALERKLRDQSAGAVRLPIETA